MAPIPAAGGGAGPGGLHYLMVGKHATTLCEQTLVPGTPLDTVEAILVHELSPALSPAPARMTFTSSGYGYHTLQRDGLTFLAMAAAAYPKDTAYRVLDDVAQRWAAVPAYAAMGSAATAAGSSRGKRAWLRREPVAARVPAYAAQEFAHVLAERAAYWADHAHDAAFLLLGDAGGPGGRGGPSSSSAAAATGSGSPLLQQQQQTGRAKQILGDLDDVKATMAHNIERVMERGERLDVLVNKTDALTNASTMFRRTTRQVRNESWWRAKKTQLLAGAGVVMLLILYVLFMIQLIT